MLRSVLARASQGVPLSRAFQGVQSRGPLRNIADLAPKKTYGKKSFNLFVTELTADAGARFRKFDSFSIQGFQYGSEHIDKFWTQTIPSGFNKEQAEEILKAGRDGNLGELQDLFDGVANYSKSSVTIPYDEEGVNTGVVRYNIKEGTITTGLYQNNSDAVLPVKNHFF